MWIQQHVQVYIENIDKEIDTVRKKNVCVCMVRWDEMNLSLDSSLFHHETQVGAFFNPIGQFILGIAVGMTYILWCHFQIFLCMESGCGLIYLALKIGPIAHQVSLSGIMAQFSF